MSLKEVTKHNRSYFAKIEGWTSLGLNLILFAIKYWAGVMSGSIAMIADAWHTLSDSITSAIVLVGAKVSQKPPDKEHPFGHGRAELIVTVIIGVILAIVGVSFINDSIVKLRSFEEANFGIVAIIVTAVSVLSKEIMARFAISFGKKVESTSMIADGWHHRTDAISSLIILVGIFAGEFYWWVDGLLGIIVGIIIIVTAYKILKDTINPLFGETLDEKLKDKIKALAKDIFENELNPHHFHVHNYGHHTELTFHIRLPGDMPLEKATRITSNFVKLIKKNLRITATIYIDAIEKKGNYEVLKFHTQDKFHFAQAREIRNIVFIEEQEIDKDLEFDGEDDNSDHYLIFDNSLPVATARCRETSLGRKLERFAVLKEYRKTGLGKLLLRSIINDLLGCEKDIYLNSQDIAVGFYEKNGFEIVGEQFIEADIIHFKMIYKL